MRRAVCPGSFDPVTKGHLDVITRAAELFDEVIVAVGVNPSKNRLFGAEERMALIERGVTDLSNVRMAGMSRASTLSMSTPRISQTGSRTGPAPMCRCPRRRLPRAAGRCPDSRWSGPTPIRAA